MFLVLRFIWIPLICILLFANSLLAKDTLNIPLLNSNISLDPIDYTDTDSIWIATQIYEGLFELDSGGDIRPRLVKGWEVSPDGRTHRFILRMGVLFSDGSPFTAEDVIFTISRLRSKSRREAALLKQIEGIKSVGDYEVSIRFSEPFQNFPRILAKPVYYILPARYAKQIGNGSYFANPVGTGPYMLKEWTRNKMLELERNSSYWGERPQIARINFVFFMPGVKLTGDNLHGFDIFIGLPAYNLRTPDRFSSVWYQHPVVEFIAFDLGHPFWRERKNRQVFTKLFNKRNYIKNLFMDRQKSWRATDSIVPYGLLRGSKARRTIMEDLPRHYVDSVKGYLSDDVNKIYFVSHNHISDERLGDAVESGLPVLRGRGYTIVRVPMDDLTRRSSGPGFAFLRLTADDFDPYEVLVYFSKDSPDNFTRYDDGYFTGQLQSARREPDEEKQSGIYEGLAHRLNEDVVVIPIASALNERLFIREGCTLRNFGPLGPWFYRLDQVECLSE